MCRLMNVYYNDYETYFRPVEMIYHGYNLIFHLLFAFSKFRGERIML